MLINFETNFSLLADLSPCLSAIENLVGAKSPPGSEQGNDTLSNGFQGDKCLNLSGSFGFKSSFFFKFPPLDRISQNKI